MTCDQNPASPNNKGIVKMVFDENIASHKLLSLKALTCLAHIFRSTTVNTVNNKPLSAQQFEPFLNSELKVLYLPFLSAHVCTPGLDHLCHTLPVNIMKNRLPLRSIGHKMNSFMQSLQLIICPFSFLFQFTT